MAPATPAHPPGSRIEDVPYAFILDHAEAFYEAKLAAATDPRVKANMNVRLAAVWRLRLFWPAHRGRDVNDLLTTAWRRMLTSTQVRKGKVDADGNRRTYAASVAESDLMNLKSFANRFRADNGLIGDVTLSARPLEADPPDWYERDDVARMLWVIRGRKWDRETGAWRIGADGKRIVEPRRLSDPARKRRWDGAQWIEIAMGEEEVAARRPRNLDDWAARLVLTALYTGAPRACILGLGWEGVEDGDESYVDLDRPIEGRTGHLHRLGPDLAPKTMAGVPVKLTRRLAAHMRRWRASDAEHGFAHILHLHAEDGFNQVSPRKRLSDLRQSLHEIMVDGGLDPIDFRHLASTTAVWIIRAAERRVGKAPGFTPSRAIMRSAAFMVGVQYKTFVEKYAALAPKFMQKQLDALMSPPGTVT